MLRTIRKAACQGVISFLALFSVPSMALAELVALFTVEDINGNGSLEVVAVAYGSPGSVIIKDLDTGVTIKQFDVSVGLTVIDAAPLGLPNIDLNGNGSQDVALLMFDPINVRPKVEIRDSRTGAKLKNVDYNKNHVPVALKIIGTDQFVDPNQAAVLAKQTNSSDRGRILIREVASKIKVNNLSLPKIFHVLDVKITDSRQGTMAPDALVLATRISDGKGFVLGWDTGGSGKNGNIQLPKNHAPIDFVDYQGGQCWRSVPAIIGSTRPAAELCIGWGSKELGRHAGVGKTPHCD
jgi:hypothetical protein